MRLYNYLNEELTQENIDIIMSECNIYLNDLKKQNSDVPHLLYSGRKSKDFYIKRDVRKNRNPRDTPVDAHNMIDKEFEKQMGIKPRSNSLFCFKDDNRAEAYGTPFAIFPIGKYKLVWSHKVDDLYSFLGYASSYFTFLKYEKDIKDTWIELSPSLKSKFDNEEDFIEYIESGKAKEYLNKMIKELVSTYKIFNASQLAKPAFSEEIMVICNEYWGIKSSLLLDNELYDKILDIWRRFTKYEII